LHHFVEIGDRGFERFYRAPILHRHVDVQQHVEPVPLTAVCFRIKGTTEADHTAVLAAPIREGTALLGPARLDGRHGIRACVTNYRVLPRRAAGPHAGSAIRNCARRFRGNPEHRADRHPAVPEYQLALLGWTCRVQAWAPTWMASQGLPSGGV
jgi:hypothetical protein